MRADSQVENPFSTLSSYLTVQYYSTKTNNYYLSQKGSHIQHIQHIQRQVGSGKCTLLRPLETHSRFHFATKHVVREGPAGRGQGWAGSCSLGWWRVGGPWINRGGDRGMRVFRKSPFSNRHNSARNGATWATEGAVES